MLESSTLAWNSLLLSLNHDNIGQAISKRSIKKTAILVWSSSWFSTSFFHISILNRRSRFSWSFFQVGPSKPSLLCHTVALCEDLCFYGDCQFFRIILSPSIYGVVFVTPTNFKLGFPKNAMVAFKTLFSCKKIWNHCIAVRIRIECTSGYSQCFLTSQYVRSFSTDRKRKLSSTFFRFELLLYLMIFKSSILIWS